MEPRRLFSVQPLPTTAQPLASAPVVTAFPNVDVAPIAGNQSEPAIAVDPSNPNRLFMASNTDVGDLGLTAAYSTDGGATWATRTIAGGDDGFPGGCCDPSATFDAFGNLFFSYLADDDAEVLVSTDGGATFAFNKAFGHDADQPTVTAGDGMVWITYDKGNNVYAAGAPVTGPGQVGAWGEPVKLKGSGGGAFGDVAIGPDGQVAVAYQKDASGRGTVGVHVDPDGVGPATFGPRVAAATTSVKQFEFIPAQSDRGIDAEAALAYDTSAGPYRGRLYLAYTDAPSKLRPDTDVFLKYSDDDGATWSAPARVNDDAGTNSQFFPRLVVDPADGQFVLSWYDARDDVGPAATAQAAGVAMTQATARSVGESSSNLSPAAERDDDDDGDHGRDDDDPHRGNNPTPTPTPTTPLPDVANDEVTVYAARGAPAPGGLLLSASARVGSGISGAFGAGNGIELGDYTGLTVANGVAHPAWADNSDAIGNNPGGAGREFDVYTAAIPLAGLPAADRAFVGGLPARATPDAPPTASAAPIVTLVAKAGPLIVTGKKPLQFAITIVDPDGTGAVNADLLATAIRVAGPNGFDAVATLKKVKTKKGVTTATYTIAGPTVAGGSAVGTWTAAANGSYAVNLVAGGVTDPLGTAAAAGTIGLLVVAAK